MLADMTIFPVCYFYNGNYPGAAINGCGAHRLNQQKAKEKPEEGDERMNQPRNSVSWTGHPLRIPVQRHRHHDVLVTVQVRRYPVPALVLVDWLRRLVHYNARGTAKSCPMADLFIRGKPCGIIDYAQSGRTASRSGRFLG